MRTVSVSEAKTHLSELIDGSEPVTIEKHGRPVATLTPLRSEARAAVERIRALKGNVPPGTRSITAAEIVASVRAGRR